MINNYLVSLSKHKEMSEKDFNLLMDLFERKLQEDFTEEEALRSLVNAGILDASGNLTEPYEMLAVNSPR